MAALLHENPSAENLWLVLHEPPASDSDAMNILLYGNCQMAGLKRFIDHTPESGEFSTRVLQDFQITLGEVTKPKVREDLVWADTVVYHARDGLFPNGEEMPPKPDSTLITSSVFYNSGYYLTNAEAEDWLPVMAYAAKYGHPEAVRYAVHEADVGYWRRRVANLNHMMEKEERENVPRGTRISDLISRGVEECQHITMNHPTSVVFVEWADRLLKHLGFAGVTNQQREDARCHKNLANLPCEDFVCSGAKKHLGLKWGGSDFENQMCEGIAKQWLRSHALSAEYSLG